VIEKARSGEVVIVTSALTMVEVVKITELGLLDQDTEQLVADFFENDFISLRNVDRFVAERARPLVREFNLKPADAIQVATALLMKVDVMHTYDEKHLLKLNGKIDGLRIELPGDFTAESAAEVKE
jgi:predicted nucleic acid-binding protein